MITHRNAIELAKEELRSVVPIRIMSRMEAIIKSTEVIRAMRLTNGSDMVWFNGKIVSTTKPTIV